MEKKRVYDERVREVEHGYFSPLVFSTSGGTATVVYKRLTSMIADKHEKPYSKTMQWIRCRLSYSLLRSAVMCQCGSRSSRQNPINHSQMGIPLTLPALRAGSQALTKLQTHSSLFIIFICGCTFVVVFVYY